MEGASASEVLTDGGAGAIGVLLLEPPFRFGWGTSSTALHGSIIGVSVSTAVLTNRVWWWWNESPAEAGKGTSAGVKASS